MKSFCLYFFFGALASKSRESPSMSAGITGKPIADDLSSAQDIRLSKQDELGQVPHRQIVPMGRSSLDAVPTVDPAKDGVSASKGSTGTSLADDFISAKDIRLTKEDEHEREPSHRIAPMGRSSLDVVPTLDPAKDEIISSTLGRRGVDSSAGDSSKANSQAPKGPLETVSWEGDSTTNAAYLSHSDVAEGEDSYSVAPNTDGISRSRPSPSAPLPLPGPLDADKELGNEKLESPNKDVQGSTCEQGSTCDGPFSKFASSLTEMHQRMQRLMHRMAPPPIGPPASSGLYGMLVSCAGACCFCCLKTKSSENAGDDALLTQMRQEEQPESASTVPSTTEAPLAAEGEPNDTPRGEEEMSIYEKMRRKSTKGRSRASISQPRRSLPPDDRN